MKTVEFLRFKKVYILLKLEKCPNNDPLLTGSRKRQTVDRRRTELLRNTWSKFGAENNVCGRSEELEQVEWEVQ